MSDGQKFGEAKPGRTTWTNAPAIRQDRRAADILQNDDSAGTAFPVTPSAPLRLSIIGEIGEREGFLDLDEERTLRACISTSRQPCQEQESQQELQDETGHA